MARGRRPTTILDEAGQLAEQMGYRWIANPHADLAFDFIMFRPTVITAVKLKKIRNAILGDLDAAKKFPGEVEALRTLPLPPQVNREFWIRTQDDRCWRRFCIFSEMTGEIGHNTAENYRNKHVNEREFDNAPYKVIIPIGKNRFGPAVLETSTREDTVPGRVSKKASEK
jgi:hypothetical protein